MAVDYDVVIIGGGSAGLVVASAMAQLKAKVALIEKHRLGGDCLWYGCVPSKSLLHAARTAYEVKHGDRFGIYTQEPKIEFKEAMGHVQRAIAAIQPFDSPERFRGLGVEVIFGEAQFIDPKTLEIEGRKLKARNYVVATGSRPLVPPIEGLKAAGFLTNETVFSLETRPDSLAVIGGGPIGCELGQAFHRLGTEVTIISSSSQLLPKDDPEAAAVVEEQLRSEGIRLIKGTRASRIEVIDGKRWVWAGEEKIAVDEILLSTGRAPTVDTLNLEAAGVEYTKKGLKVNEKLQTTNPSIYGCGDVLGGYQFTHVAGYEAAVVVQNLLRSAAFLPGAKADYSVIPWATFTEPELARVGLTEKQAIARYGEDNVYILKQEFAHVDRAQAEGATAGFAKIMTKGNGEILGATLVGPSAGELLHEIIMAMKNKLKVSALTSHIHIYPTLSEVNSKAALQLTKQKYAKNEFLQNLLTKFFNFRRSL